MKIIFLDEYSIAGCDTSKISALGEYVGYHTTTPEQLVERCVGAQVIISNKVVIDGAIMDQLPSLRLICVAATGMNNIDLPAAAERGIEVRNAVGYSTHSVAEATLGAALTLLRQSSYYDRYIKSGEYSRSTKLFNFDRTIHQLHGKRWGIIGMGNIGRRVAQIASAFGAEVRYYSTSGAQRKEEYKSVATLSELLSGSDIISIHSPLNDTTAGLIGAEELSQMAPHAILINMARGGIVDEVAILEALNSGVIAAAASDVFAQEPLPSDSPLLGVKDPDKLLLSPHTAWSAREAIEALVEAVAKNIEEFLS